jgi:hypothetical protein
MQLLRGIEGLDVKTNDECFKVPKVKVAIFRNVPPASTFAHLS